MNRLPDEMTLKEKYGPAMRVEDQAAADAYFEACVEHSMRRGHERAAAEQLERHNLGFWAGFYDDETRARVERLFRCVHPVLGPFALARTMTDAEVLRAGMELAAKRTIRAEEEP